jgi:hypothetical protein
MEELENAIESANPPSDADKNFLQFITEEGWKYLAPCGCRTQMDKYSNDGEKYKDYEIWLNKEQSIFEIRAKGDRISRKIATASAFYYLQVYNNYFQK